MLFNRRFKKFHIGNIAEKSFKEIWQSDKYKEVLDYLASDKFNPQTDCGTLCLQHKANEFLWDLKQGKEKLTKPTAKPPLHINFV
jgi:MoaA/NifB/PqqE/SkfB family radical SAM enzyme